MDGEITYDIEYRIKFEGNQPDVEGRAYYGTDDVVNHNKIFNIIASKEINNDLNEAEYIYGSILPNKEHFGTHPVFDFDKPNLTRFLAQFYRG